MDQVNEEQMDTVLEAWKKTIDVQQHFNLIEMQVRSIAVTVLTATIAAAAVVKGQENSAVIEAFKASKPVLDGSYHLPWGWRMAPAGGVVLAGLVGWAAFYLLDRLWYHRLLVGAVEHAKDIEKLIGPEYKGALRLASRITQESRFKVWKTDKEIKARTRIDWFYGLVGTGLFILMMVLARPSGFGN